MALKNKTHEIEPATRQRAPQQIALNSPEHERPLNPIAALQRVTSSPSSSLRPADILTLQRTIGNRAVQRVLDNQPDALSPRSATSPNAIAIQLQPEEEEQALQGKFETAPRTENTLTENSTGLPDELKAGIENLSGLSLDDVKIHYNSSKPAGMHALAYTLGTDIHIGPGQQKYLPHESWHVVQQKQGRVRPTLQANGLPVNDDHELEREADVMGHSAIRVGWMNSQTDGSRDSARLHGKPSLKPGRLSSCLPNQVFQRGARPVIQRVVKVGDAVKDFKTLRDEVLKTNQYALKSYYYVGKKPAVEEVDEILKRWVDAPAESQNPFKTSEDRSYETYEDVARALFGEMESKGKMQQEKEEAALVMQDANKTGKDLNSLMEKIKDKKDMVSEKEPAGRYKFHYGIMFSGSMKDEITSWKPTKSVKHTIALMLDFALVKSVRKSVKGMLEEAGKEKSILSEEQDAARKTHWNPNESAQWTLVARSKHLPLSAGPSATTGQIMNLARAIGATEAEMLAVAAAAFAYWQLHGFRSKSGIHTKHEVYDVQRYHRLLEIEFVLRLVINDVDCVTLIGQYIQTPEDRSEEYAPKLQE